jgi:hypothetical protein
MALFAQKLMRRSHEPIDLQKVFAVDQYDTAAMARLVERIAGEQDSSDLPANDRPPRPTRFAPRP